MDVSSSSSQEGQSISYEKCGEIESNNGTFDVIEFPGHVQNPHKAISMLGGETAVSSWLSSASSRLECSFRSNPLAHPVRSNTSTKASGLILRVSRKRKKSTTPSVKKPKTVSNDEDLVVKVEGRLHKMATFQGLADFQYVGPPQSSSIAWRYSPSFPHVGHSEPISAPLPPLTDFCKFSATSTPSPSSTLSLTSSSSLLSLSSSSSSSSSSTSTSSKGSPKFCGHMDPLEEETELWLTPRVFSRSNMPSVFDLASQVKPKKEISSANRPGSLSSSKTEVNERNVPIVALLREIFEARPVCSIGYLRSLESLDGIPDNRLKFCLSHVTTRMTQGSWRNLYIKMGVEPLKDPQYRVYQSIDFRGTYRSSSPLPTNKKDIVSFKVLPTQDQTLYQLCDIPNKRIREILSQPVLTQAPSDKLSWLTEGMEAEIRSILKNRADLIKRGVDLQDEVRTPSTHAEWLEILDQFKTKQEPSAAISSILPGERMGIPHPPEPPLPTEEETPPQDSADQQLYDKLRNDSLAAFDLLE